MSLIISILSLVVALITLCVTGVALRVQLKDRAQYLLILPTAKIRSSIVHAEQSDENLVLSFSLEVEMRNPGMRDFLIEKFQVLTLLDGENDFRHMPLTLQFSSKAPCKILSKGSSKTATSFPLTHYDALRKQATCYRGKGDQRTKLNIIQSIRKIRFVVVDPLGKEWASEDFEVREIERIQRFHEIITERAIDVGETEYVH